MKGNTNISKKMSAASALLGAILMGASGGTGRSMPKGYDDAPSSRKWTPNIATPPGCKGARSMTAAAQKRAAKKRNNIRKNPRGAK